MSNNDELTLNLLILGQTGVGKSSLINALVGYIEPMEHSLPLPPIHRIGIFPQEAEIDGKKVAIWELEAVKNEELEKIINISLEKEKGIDRPIEKWFHSVTYCIQAGGLKIQDFDIKIIKQFIDNKYNVIIALTKADQIDKEKEKKFIEIIKKEIKEATKTDITVITVSAYPEQLDNMTEKPKPFGLEEYKEAILISWREIFINRIPLHIIDKLKKDIINAKINAPREGKELEKLVKEIQEYFINVVNKKLHNHIKDNCEKYYKITADILTVSKNIDISNLNLHDSINNFDFDSRASESIRNIAPILLLPPLLSGLIGLIQLIVSHAKKSERINDYINEISQKIIDKISEKEFESEIRKIIIETLNEIDKKITKSHEKGYFEDKNHKEENKNINNENKINNVVENTAKEKIMQPKEQRIKCKEIINSYKAQIGNINFIVPNSIISLNASLNVSKNSPNITLFTIPEYISIIKSMTVSLAKVFNKDITKKELEKIILDLKEDLKDNPDSEKYKDFESMCWSIVEKLDDELKLNLLILGQTGVGKSSLLNALVGEYVEKTSSGLPETPKERINEKGEIESGIYPHEAEIDGKRVIIHDSWGLEVGKDEEWEKIVNEELKKKGIDKDIKDWFHSVTYCIQAGGYKIQDFDIKIIKKFMDGKYNVIIALTKADQIDEEKEKELIEIIKKETGINMVIPISANPQKSRGMTEAPKPFGLTEYKAAILISWKNIFIDRIPLHIIEKLKKDIEKAKINAPREGNNLKKLAEEIQEYFINVLKEKLQIYMKENFKKYYKITEDILTVSKNIDISNLNIISNMDNPDYIFNVFNFDSSIFETIGKGFILLFAPILGILIGAIQLIYFYATKSEKINDYINEISQTMIDKIGEKEFESEIRKIIIETLNEIDKKIIKLN